MYVSDYYQADVAVTAYLSDARLRKDGDIIILSPPAISGTTINGIPENDTALIFYPGGKVEYTAYIPMLEKLSQSGITCVLVKMPFILAVFDSNAADRMIAKLPEVKNWYIGGHSLGGAMASEYAAKYKDKIKGPCLARCLHLRRYRTGKFDHTVWVRRKTLCNACKYRENILSIYLFIEWKPLCLMFRNHPVFRKIVNNDRIFHYYEQVQQKNKRIFLPVTFMERLHFLNRVL